MLVPLKNLLNVKELTLQPITQDANSVFRKDKTESKNETFLMEDLVGPQAEEITVASFEIVHVTSNKNDEVHICRY